MKHVRIVLIKDFENIWTKENNLLLRDHREIGNSVGDNPGEKILSAQEKKDESNSVSLIFSFTVIL